MKPPETLSAAARGPGFAFRPPSSGCTILPRGCVARTRHRARHRRRARAAASATGHATRVNGRHKRCIVHCAADVTALKLAVLLRDAAERLELAARPNPERAALAASLSRDEDGHFQPH